MKNLKVLIIVDDEKLSAIGAKLVAVILSELKLGANFFYAKSFDSALNTPQTELIKSGYYDVVCVLDDVASFTLYSVVDSIELAAKKSYYFILSSDISIIDQLKEDGPHRAFLLNEQHELSTLNTETIKKELLAIRKA